MVDKTTLGEAHGGTALITDVIRIARTGGNFKHDWSDVLPLVYTDATLKADLIAAVKSGFIFPLIIPISSPVDPVTAGVAVSYFDFPFAFTPTAAAASLLVPSSVGNVIVDINEAGVSILGNKIVIEATEINSATAATQPTVVDTSIAAGARITFDVDAAGTSADAVYLVVYLMGHL